MRSLHQRRRLVVIVILACTVFLAIALAVVSWFAVGVKVTLTNRTGADVKNLEIRFTGGTVTIAILMSGASFRTSVQSTGESHLELRFRDGAGEVRRETIGVYFEPSYRGEVSIDLAPDGTVHYEDRIRLPWPSGRRPTTTVPSEKSVRP